MSMAGSSISTRGIAEAADIELDCFGINARWWLHISSIQECGLNINRIHLHSDKHHDLSQCYILTPRLVGGMMTEICIKKISFGLTSYDIIKFNCTPDIYFNT